ncbi:MAG TPA: hypothetical protein VJX67_04230 [Blastocatellia bacterium]|nr:hypothetical protein [Blastocatellia bacterium]
MKTLAVVLLVSISLLMSACFASFEKKMEPGQAPHVTAADEIAARFRLISIAQAEARHQAESPDATYALLPDLIQSGDLTDPSKGQLTRYRFEVELRPNGFVATAVPEKYGITGNQSFYIDETQTIRGADKHGAKATASDPSL